jgi:hypothetical protein
MLTRLMQYWTEYPYERRENDDKGKLEKFGNPVSSDRGGKTSQAVLTA